jgi:hypothetical protein
MFGAGRSAGGGYLIALRRQSKHQSSRNNSKDWIGPVDNTQVRLILLKKIRP